MSYARSEKDLFDFAKWRSSLTEPQEGKMDQINMKNEPTLDNFWMPFTANRQFKANPRLLASAEGMYYTDVDGKRVLDGTAGLWC